MDNKQTPNEFVNTPDEFSSDFIVETDNVVTTEIPEIPGEYTADGAAEQAAADNRYYNGYNEYHTETADEFDEPDDDYYTEVADDEYYGNEPDEEYYGNEPDEEYYDPEDEQAATRDYDSDLEYACAKCKLDDYEIISDVLGSEKQIVSLYSTALCEAAEENFRTVLRGNLDYAADDQYKAFEFMQSRGMYTVEQASDNDLSKTKQQLSPLCQNDCNSNSGAECSCDNCYCSGATDYEKSCHDGDCDI